MSGRPSLTRSKAGSSSEPTCTISNNQTRVEPPYPCLKEHEEQLPPCIAGIPISFTWPAGYSFGGGGGESQVTSRGLTHQVAILLIRNGSAKL